MGKLRAVILDQLSKPLFLFYKICNFFDQLKVKSLSINIVALGMDPPAAMVGHHQLEIFTAWVLTYAIS